MPSGFCKDCAQSGQESEVFFDASKEAVIKGFETHHLNSLPLSGPPKHNCHVFVIFSGDSLDGEWDYVVFASGKEDRQTAREVFSYSSTYEVEYFKSLHISLRRTKEGD